MFELVDLYESGSKKKDLENAANEAELKGGPEAGHIHLDALLGWMRKVNADTNAKYLKCLDWRSNRVDVNNIVTVTCDENIIHKSRGVEETFPRAVKIAFKEESTVPAMTIADAYALFEAIASKCEEDGIDLGNVEVFVENEKGKLTYFSWYYDEGTDTAVVIKNMSPNAAKEFLNNGAAALIERAAKSSTTMDTLVNQLEKIKEQMAKLRSKEDDLYSRMEGLDESEDEESEKKEAKSKKDKSEK